MLAYPLHAFFFNYLRVCRPPGRSRPFPIQRRRSHGLFGHCSARRSLTTWAHVSGVKFCSGDPRVLAHCVVDISKGLDGVPQTTEVLTYSVEALSPFSRPFCLCGLQLFDCLVVTLALFVEVRVSQHGEQVVRPRENARAFIMAPPASITMLAIISGYQLE